MKLNFYKEDSGEWYIDLPEYLGPKADLQMVYGADTMLDLIGKGHSYVSIEIRANDHKLFTTPYRLKKMVIPQTINFTEGQWYSLDYRDKTYAVWLCDVTKFVFGDFPEYMQFKVIEHEN